jgi:hypothetical protein
MDYVPGMQFWQIFIKFYILQYVFVFYNSESIKIFSPKIDTFKLNMDLRKNIFDDK